MSRKDFEKDLIVEMWPDTQRSISIFIDLSTQWRGGMSGPTGLDYAALPFVLRARRVPRDEWPQVFDDIRVMEIEALKEMQS